MTTNITVSQISQTDVSKIREMCAISEIVSVAVLNTRVSRGINLAGTFNTFYVDLSSRVTL